MAKKNKKTPQQVFSPEQYLKTRVRQLPIYKCYKSTVPGDTRQMAIFVARQHPQGNITFGGYMLDRWCLGVKDALWEFYVNPSELDGYMAEMNGKAGQVVEEIDYVEAHNWVYGAHDWAADAGIEPAKDFGLARYILEPDDDNVELIEYDFGKDGEYWLMARTNFEASKYIPTLKKNLGEGNFQVIIDERLEYSDEEEDERYFGGFKIVPSMKYTYKGKKYPKTAKLHHNKVKKIVETSLENISDEQIEDVFSLPTETLREDLHALIMQQIGLQWGKTGDELDEKEISWETVGNSLIFLTKVGTIEDTFPVVLELLRQSDDFISFNFGDIPETLLTPVIYTLCKDNPSMLIPFLLEEGPCPRAKIIVLDLLQHMADNHPEMCEEFLSISKTILEAYKIDLPNRTICDGSVVAFAISIPLALKATELQPLAEELYKTGLVDEGVYGHIDELREYFIEGLHHYKLPPTDPYSIRNAYIHFIEMNKRFEEQFCNNE